MVQGGLRVHQKVLLICDRPFEQNISSILLYKHAEKLKNTLLTPRNTPKTPPGVPNALSDHYINGVLPNTISLKTYKSIPPRARHESVKDETVTKLCIL